VIREEVNSPTTAESRIAANAVSLFAIRPTRPIKPNRIVKLGKHVSLMSELSGTLESL